MARRSLKIKRRPLTKKLMPWFGKMGAPVLVVLDPVVGNENFKKPFNSNQLQWFADRLKHFGGFGKEDIQFISCAPPVTKETWDSNAKTSAHLKENRDAFMDQVLEIDPKMIIACGAKAVGQLVGRSIQITKVRGQSVELDVVNNIPMVPTLSPFYAQRRPELDDTFCADLETAGRIADAGYDIAASIVETRKDYEWCYDLSPIIKKRPKRIAVDIEGIGLRAYDPSSRLLTVQLTTEEGEAFCVPLDYNAGDLRHHTSSKRWRAIWHKKKRKMLVRQLKRLLEDPRIEIVGHNFKFDWLFLYYKLGIKANYTHDTMLMAHLLNENLPNFSLNDLVRLHVREMAGYNDILDNDPEHQSKKRMDLLTPDKMLQYACGDTDATFRLADTLLAQLEEDEQLMQCYRKVSMAGINAFCWVELNGFTVNIEALRAFEKYLAAHQKKEKKALLRMLPKTIRDKWKDNGVGLKPERRAILSDYLYTHEDGLQLEPVKYTKTGLPSVSSKEALPYYVADSPFVARVSEYIKNEKMLNTYVAGFYKYIYEGKIRPSYLLHGTVTGRSASRDPNGQNFPKRGKMAKLYRAIFEAPPGWVYISCDLSQAELRIAAMMSGDQNMLDVYAQGGDIHKMTAAGCMGLTLEEFEALDDDIKGLKRFQAKAVNFGFLYGMWWVKFRSYAKTDYGIDYSEDEARELREMFFRTYPMLQVWHDEVKDYVQQHGQIRTYDGRIRHLPMVFSDDEGIAKGAQRQAINSPVQSIASDLGIMTLGRLVPHIIEKELDWIKPCGFIHDAIVCLVREDKVAAGCALVKRYMENNPLTEWFGWEPEIPITADAEIGRNLAQTYEINESTFVGRRNRKKSYADLLEPEIASIRAKLAATDDADRRSKLRGELNAVRRDARGSVRTVSRRRKRENVSRKPIAQRRRAA